MHKKRLGLLGVLLVISISLFFTASFYARPQFGEDCLSCHTGGGVTVTSNITETINITTLNSFSVEIDAEGDAEGLTVIWSAVDDNPSFIFFPSEVIDNGPNDLDPTEMKVKGIFEVTTPAAGGEYTIRVFAAGKQAKGGTLTLQVTVESEGPPENWPPNPFFLYSQEGLTIKFSDRSWDVEGNVVSWYWDFGDGTNSTERNPTHTYSKADTYTVTLTVTDDQGKTNTKSQTFMVPSKAERLFMWTEQVIVVSVTIILLSIFAVGIAARRRRGKVGK